VVRRRVEADNLVKERCLLGGCGRETRRVSTVARRVLHASVAQGNAHALCGSGCGLVTCRMVWRVLRCEPAWIGRVDIWLKSEGAR
jgi:hypothetical protein